MRALRSHAVGASAPVDGRGAAAGAQPPSRPIASEATSVRLTRNGTGPDGPAGERRHGGGRRLGLGTVRAARDRDVAADQPGNGVTTGISAILSLTS